MRKKMLVVLMVGLVSAFTLTACGGDSKKSDKSEKAEEKKEDKKSADEDADEEDVDDADEEDADDSEGSDDEALAENLEKAEAVVEQGGLNVFYAGVTEDENTKMLCSFSAENSFGIVEFFNTETDESGSWVGELTDNGDDSYTVSDTNNGTSLTFSVVVTDGAYVLTMGELGNAVVTEIEQDEFVACIAAVETGAEPQF